MKKKAAWALALLLTLALLAGCTQKPAAQPEGPAAEPESAGTNAPDAPAAPYMRPEVANNGGTFVRVGEKIWFRRYDAHALDETRLWGEFFAVMPSHAVTSTLCCYDTESDAVLEMFPDDGFGPLWFGEDGFYLARAKGESSETYFKSADGTETVLGEGTVAGVSDNGRFAAVQSGDALTVYEGTEQKYRKVGAAEFCALTDDGTLVYSDGVIERMDADGHTEILGVLPELPEGVGAYAWEFEQCLVSGGDVWCTFGAYEGTGHFLGAALVVRAKLDTPSSLETVEDRPETEYPFVPKLCLDSDGTVLRAEHARDELELSEGTCGDLMVYDEDFTARVLVRNFIPNDPYEMEGGLIPQAMETVGDAAYLAVAEAFRDPVNDVGWRMAFTPGEIYYLRVPLSGDAGVGSLDGKPVDAFAAPTAEEVYESLVGTWVLTATEVEGERSDTLPDGLFEYVEFCEGEVRAVIDSSGPGTDSYYNVFDHAEILPTMGVNADAAPYGLLLTSEGSDDMMYVYLEGDMLTATVMVHIDSEFGADSLSRTGFYVRSMG